MSISVLTIRRSPAARDMPAGHHVVGLVASLTTGDQDWQERALCAQTDPDAFFPEKGGSAREAKKVCGRCEVRPECLEHALKRGERYGVWGGMTERERRQLARASA
jgi:WhiB family redox-sensing transcriptional regulator